MRLEGQFLSGKLVCGTMFVLVLGASCGKASSGGGAGQGSATGGDSGQGGAGTSTGGSPGSGGDAVGTGGATGSGGSRATSTGGVMGSGGAAAGSGGSTAGTGGAGSGGMPGSGGATSPPDAGPDSATRDSRRGADASTSRDAVVDVAAVSADSGSPTGDGGCVPDYSCKPTSPNTGDPAADCVARVNQFRACVCLPPLARWTAGEACADQDSQYDSQQSSAHAGFIAGICASGNAQDECPDWGGYTDEKVIDQCLQMMFDEGPPPTASCTGTCYEAHGHYINMTGTSYKSGVACGFYTTASGSVWAAQNFQ